MAAKINSRCFGQVNKSFIEEVPKWQYRREKYQSREEIKDVHRYGSSMLPHFQDAQTAESLQHPIEFARTAASTRVYR